MKLKYILPVATIASVATIVTPLVTSCGPKNENIASWTAGKEYKPLDPKEAHEFTGPGAVNDRIDAYREDIANNKFIFGDDMVYYFYLRATGEETKKYFGIRSFSIELTDVSSTIEPNNNIQIKHFTASYKMKMDATIKVESPVGGEWTLEFTNREATIENIPLFINDESDKIHCSLAPAWENDNNWKFNMPEIVITGTTIMDANISIGESNTDYTKEIVDDETALFKQIFPTLIERMFEFDSNYYSLQTIGNELN